MLVICNGSPKSGSTWIYSIIKSTKLFSPVPENRRNKAWKNYSLKDELIPILEKLPFCKNKDTYCKQHWSGDPILKQLAANEDFRFLNIVRDLRDVCVSRYFHELRRGDFSGSIDEYFSRGVARQIIREYIDYHRFWHGDKTNYAFLASYEALLADFPAHTGEILEYVGVLDNTERSRLVAIAFEATNFSNYKSTGEGQFFRSGKSGDYKNHLTTGMIDEVFSVAQACDYLAVKKNMAANYPSIAEYLKNTDIGAS